MVFWYGSIKSTSKRKFSSDDEEQQDENNDRRQTPNAKRVNIALLTLLCIFAHISGFYKYGLFCLALLRRRRRTRINSMRPRAGVKLPKPNT